MEWYRAWKAEDLKLTPKGLHWIKSPLSERCLTLSSLVIRTLLWLAFFSLSTWAICFLAWAKSPALQWAGYIALCIDEGQLRFPVIKVYHSSHILSSLVTCSSIEQGLLLSFIKGDTAVLLVVTSGGCTTEPGYAGDIVATEIWLVDWLIDACRIAFFPFTEIKQR